jgi:regulator of replication initiation timing
VRIPVFLFTSTLALLAMTPAGAQVPDPGQAQDAEAAREKLLKASDQLDNMQANSEATKLSVDGMKNDVAALQANVQKLQSDNAALKQQLTDLQTALADSEAARIKDRQTLIDNVAAMLAAGKGSGTSTKKKKATASPDDETDTSLHLKTSDAQGGISLAPPPDSNPTLASTDTAPPPAHVDTPAPTPKHGKGYYHVVAEGETVELICDAYRSSGLNVTLAQIRKANGLTENSVLKVGQKIFIPKPGA